jgi:hypothetical protein
MPMFNDPRYANDGPTPMTIEAPARIDAETPAQFALRACRAAAEYQAEHNAAAAADYRVDQNGNPVGKLSHQGYLDKKQAVKTSEAAQRLELAEIADARRVEEAQQKYDAAVKGLTTQGDTADELRRNRFADRMHRKFDAAQGDVLKTSLAQRMVEEASPAELSVLLEELPTRLPDTSWLPAKLKQVNPEVGAATEELWKARQSSALTQYAIAATRRGFDSGIPTPKVVLDKLAPAVARVDPDRPQADPGAAAIQSRDGLKGMSPTEVMEAYRAGRLDNLMGRQQ